MSGDRAQVHTCFWQMKSILNWIKRVKASLTTYSPTTDIYWFPTPTANQHLTTNTTNNPTTDPPPAHFQSPSTPNPRTTRNKTHHGVQPFSSPPPKTTSRPADTLYDGAFLRARMSFPAEFPLLPPKLRFTTQMWHPNIYPDGTVCISILHPPGNDEYGYEDAGERWLPVHTIESILVSVTSLLASESPNTESPANIDAAKELRDDPASYKKKVRRLARKSAEDCFD
ncbi:hypothetical protein PGTUg99_018817 [Puccinia graminis f. sp. tritici]|uniref:UBC core domain-containing protein n=1 Tax=Puccinia graminis f. sp. tritici TaxID=56615 RepID=A0A5B0RCZ3_PUCGR|nr:hypothetical protein PGTUg99_018817 [Puccinia graminis f. sp. tritici]